MVLFLRLLVMVLLVMVVMVVVATAAQLNSPTGFDCVCDGEVFIADAFNHRVRKVDVDGIISTVAGNGNAVVL